MTPKMYPIIQSRIAVLSFFVSILLLPSLIIAPSMRAETNREHISESKSNTDFFSIKNRRRVEMLTHAIERHPDNINLYNSRGWYNFQLGEYKKVVTDYDRIIELGPENLEPHYQPIIHYVRGLSLLKLGEEQLAIESLKIAANIFKSQNNSQGLAEVTNVIDSIDLDN